jgi:hypothetical protein
MPGKSDFMAAEEIKAILHGRDKAEQERIIRWVSESANINVSRGAGPTNVSQQLPPSLHPSGATQAAPLGIQHRKDIKSFVGERAPKNDVQFAAVAAYFYRFEASEGERKEFIVPEDLQNAGRQARGFGFKKPLVTLNNAVALGYFDRAGRGEFKLNAVGENLVAMTLPGGESSGKRRSRTHKNKGSAKRSKKRKTS